MQILVAEDEPVSRLLLERSLLAWGYDPVICCDGVEALEALRRSDAPQIAVLDWMMPNLDGLDVCRALRAAKRPTEHYLIILTARSSQEDVIRGLQAGADDYLTKPIDRGELEMRLQVAGARDLATAAARRARRRARIGPRPRAATAWPAAHLRVLQAHPRRPELLASGESYLADHSDVQFSHGICPSCLERVMSDDQSDEMA